MELNLIMQEFLNFLSNILPFLIAIPIVIILVLASHIKAPPDRAIIISGLRKEPRILIGRTGIKFPFLEKVDQLWLKQMVMEVISGRSVSTADYMSIQIFAVIKLRISDEPEALKNAMRNFLTQYPEETMGELQNPLQAILREIAGTKKLEEILKDKEGFANQVHKRASEILEKLGIEVISCVIKSIEDEAGIIKAMGVERATQIQKHATIVKAEADREISIKCSEAKREANEVHVTSEAEILLKNNELEMQQADLKKEQELKNIEIELEIAEKNNMLGLRKADLKKIEDERLAEAEMAFEETTLAKRRDLKIAESDMLMDREERELKIKEKAAEVKEKVLEAEVKQAADAERYKQQQLADAELYASKQQAEAQKVHAELATYVSEQQAITSKSKGEIKKQEADAYLYAKKQESQATKLNADACAYTAEQETHAMRVTGLCEAETIKAKGIAEAQSLKLKAEAMKHYDQAAIVEMIVSTLPEIAKNISQPISEIDNVTIVGDSTDAITGISKDVLDTMSKVQDIVKDATGVDLKDMASSETAFTNNEPPIIDAPLGNNIPPAITGEMQPDAPENKEVLDVSVELGEILEDLEELLEDSA